MTLPPPPSPLTETDREVLADKFAEHSIPKDREQRQEHFREKLRDSKRHDVPSTEELAERTGGDIETLRWGLRAVRFEDDAEE